MGLSGKVADIQLMEGNASVQRIPDIYRKWRLSALVRMQTQAEVCAGNTCDQVAPLGS